MVNRVKKQKRITRRGTRCASRRGTRHAFRRGTRRRARRRARRVSRHRRGGGWSPFGKSTKAKEEQCKKDKEAAEVKIGMQARLLAEKMKASPQGLAAELEYAVNEYNKYREQTPEKALRVLGEDEIKDLPEPAAEGDVMPECDEIKKWQGILSDYLAKKLSDINSKELNDVRQKSTAKNPEAQKEMI